MLRGGKNIILFKEMRVRIVCYEEVNAWILGKLATCLADELRLQGVTVEIGKTADLSADINYHIIYSSWNSNPSSSDTLMITHIDNMDKVELTRCQMKVAEMGICLSSDTMHKLAALGIPRAKLSFINFPSPQHGKIQPHKISMGITSRCHAHGSKREYLLAQLAPRLEPGEFIFHIIGQGWDAVIDELRRYGSEVVYHGDFSPELYCNFWQQLDYYLYLGQDEGSTGFLDAMEAGVPAITTPQGFHLDLPEGLTYPFNDLESLTQIFWELAGERQKRRLAVSGISWSDYARKHLIIWKEILNRRSGQILYSVTKEELDSVGMNTTIDNPFHNSWLAPLPAASGPGGAVHRPRLLLVADESQEILGEVWQKIIRSAPQNLPIFLNYAGSPSVEGKIPSCGLEILLLDYRKYSDEEIEMLSFDFDAVGFWNFSPLRLLKLLQHRSKPNFVLRFPQLLKISSHLKGRSLMARLLRRLFFGFINSHRTRSRAVTVSFWTHCFNETKTYQQTPDSLRKFFSNVDSVIYSDSEWETELKLIARDFSKVPHPETEGSWNEAFKTLFRTMHNNPAKESHTVGLFLARVCGFIARHLSWRK